MIEIDLNDPKKKKHIESKPAATKAFVAQGTASLMQCVGVF